MVTSLPNECATNTGLRVVAGSVLILAVTKRTSSIWDDMSMVVDWSPGGIPEADVPLKLIE